jgi:hypothetical protein
MQASADCVWCWPACGPLIDCSGITTCHTSMPLHMFLGASHVGVRLCGVWRCCQRPEGRHCPPWLEQQLATCATAPASLVGGAVSTPHEPFLLLVTSDICICCQNMSGVAMIFMLGADTSKTCYGAAYTHHVQAYVCSTEMAGA